MAGTGPAPRGPAWRAVALCVGRSAVLLARGRVHLPRENVGRILRFADGSVTRVFRETRVDDVLPADPCVLVVAFTLRLVRGRVHRLFEAESILNTPLFVGFPGMVTKLWCAHDAAGNYRGFYEWDGPQQAQHYASALWRVLELVCVPGTIRYKVLPGLRRDEALAEPTRMATSSDGPDGAWWRLLAAE
ncbi:hypothetical protein [Sinomonas sp.]|uniref:hypothetical protein n=1 Tax=Sinomonas sp. TaxID=1914986 RepID=UPI002FE37CB2